MIGIVVVSHSRALAEAAVALAAEMVDEAGRPTTVIAAGLDDGSFGTDAVAVAEALVAADSGDGVLVMVDLGSAVLSAEMALEFIDPDTVARVRLTPAPLVEGLVAATVAASTGSGLAAVAAEAERGLTAKESHLGEPTEGAATDGETAAPSYDHQSEIVVPNAHGLHARPAAAFVRLVAGHDADVRVRNLDSGRGPVDARSLSGVATLDARQGHRLLVESTGSGAVDILRALESFAAQGFGDDIDASSPSSASAEPTRGSGLDVAIGPALVVGRAVDLSSYAPQEPAGERRRLDEALAAVRARLGTLSRDAAAQLGEDAGAVFEAHLAMLDDPGVLTPVRAAVDSGVPAPEAYADRMDSLSAEFAGLADPYQRERAQDVTSVRDRVLAALSGVPLDDVPDGQGVLVVETLDPATAAALDATQIIGVVTRSGGATGHGVLLARARGIPLIDDVHEAEGVATGDVVAFDASSRRFVARPDEATTQEFERLVRDRTGERDDAVAHADEPVVLADGTTVHVMANIASVADARSAAELGADGAGLLRTELLFADRGEMPSVREQAEAYVEVARALGGPMTIRTWDVGADKPLSYLPLPREDNPFLGRRGLRAFEDAPGALVDQLEAVCRAAAEAPSPMRVMFPMVTTPDEVDWALSRLDEAAERVGGRPDNLQVGVMIEVPAAALTAAEITRRLDFVSIGTNDLTQYVMAAERGNGGVAHLLDPGSPAVLRLIEIVCREVRSGVEVAVCGDAASRPDLAERLVSLGIRELSASPPAIPVVKARLRRAALDS
ncbi:phosphoenolpyruvate--protein phosphotransferase [Luteipulveratus mongoliensis]|uniref:phosphoenolpyruvate--protein phosphotransferase n=1 Tax=Luteipulveratus mongoliensis TaxID=571913 RepID=UPI0009F9724E|nr:phosphoenolpyruvate--protein phosphotransferase [Luteipulveratus mongoliensis]